MGDGVGEGLGEAVAAAECFFDDFFEEDVFSDDFSDDLTDDELLFFDFFAFEEADDPAERVAGVAIAIAVHRSQARVFLMVRLFLSGLML